MQPARNSRLDTGRDTFFTYDQLTTVRREVPLRYPVPLVNSCRAAGVRLSNLGAHLQLAQPGNHHGPNAVLVPRDHVFELGGAQRLKLDPAVVA